ncbi:MAG: hypothetical protein K9L70_05905 [Thiohalocapsa sp.]|jgi:hypothetical protein|nr:hypothetical protein [Thiohalocapsa sp.]MCF7988944.1 hypothetical protein [Thiohalocapsa sp.]
MLAPLAVAALLIGSVSTAVVVNDDQAVNAQKDRAPVVEVQTIETANPFIED